MGSWWAGRRAGAGSGPRGAGDIPSCVSATSPLPPPPSTFTNPRTPHFPSQRPETRAYALPIALLSCDSGVGVGDGRRRDESGFLRGQGPPPRPLPRPTMAKLWQKIRVGVQHGELEVRNYPPQLLHAAVSALRTQFAFGRSPSFCCGREN